MINVFYESLLLAPNRVLAHGINCCGSFNSGLSKQIGIMYPEVKKFYLKKYHKEGWRLGDMQMVACEEDCRVIANIGIQHAYGKVGKFVDYRAIESGLNKLFAKCKEYEQVPALSQIGCGLGGCDWDKVLNIIKSVSSRWELDADLYIYRMR